MSNSEICKRTLVVGRISAVFGVRGWVKIVSYTERAEDIVNYQPWLVDRAGGQQLVEVDDWKSHGDGLLAHLKGVDDRDIAGDWCQRDIRVAMTLLPELSDSQFYWHQLEHLVVYSHFEKDVQRLGVVTSILETGANDVLVVTGDAQSIDRRERLIPYAEQYILNIDLGLQRIDVAWDPDF